ncbi:hypothetical protein SAY86_023806 [Trapa natans]|uniref:lipid-A-disaccharide synthase n=1 Tax=Trapa natans TaxID=22666 RepID=A0AAN7MB17_TRANT|nr:hypothetical protein SAY86_023806 [Trapa natans]
MLNLRAGLVRRFSWQSRGWASASGRSLADVAADDGELRVFVVAGEVSGDTIGSRLMASLKNLSPFPVRFAGVGGPLMIREGLTSLFAMEDISVMGIWELLPHLKKFRVNLRETMEAALVFQPHVVVTIDSKGFSFRLLKQLRDKYDQRRSVGPVHFHYVAPSFWAWKGGEERLTNLAKFVDHIFCILPNEEEICKLNGLGATFVGHPLLEDALQLDQVSGKLSDWKLHGDHEKFKCEHQVPSGATIISLLPGSRLQEVSRMLPIFWDTIKLLKESIPQLLPVIHVAPNQYVEKYIDGAVQRWPTPVTLIPGGKTQLKYDAFSASRLALCTSGTVAVELQLARLPCVVAYRAHFLTELFIRCKAKIPYISLPNILLNSPVIPEALLQDCRPPRLASLLMELLHDEGCRANQVLAADKVIKLLWPSKEVIDTMAGNLCSDYTPSSMAALTLLHYVKPT